MPATTMSKEEISFTYLDLSLEFESSPPEIDETIFRYVITLALGQLHGDIGAAMMVDLMKYDQRKLQAVLRIQQRDLVKLWSALTLYGYYNDRKCAFNIHKVSPNLVSLSVDSRQGMKELLGGCG